MLNPSGYSIITDPAAGRPIEHDTFTCAHCGFITFTSGGVGKPMQVVVMSADGIPRTMDARKCGTCWQWVCPKASCNDCQSRFAKIEAEEKAALKKFICDTF